MKTTHKLIFVGIIFLTIFLRFYRLGSIPSGLNWDEISHGYNAYSLLQTGKDQWGTDWPIFNFRAYGDYPTTANLYLTMPFIKIFGLNSFAIRLPHALLGLLFVIYIYKFTKIFTKDNRIAVLTAFIAAISPWSVFPSRGVFQSNLSQTFILMGIYYFYLGIKKPTKLLLSSLFFGVSVYSYHNARIIIPLLIPVLVYFNFSSLKQIFTKHHKTTILSIIILLVLLVPNMFNLISSESSARNRWVGIINPNSINLINEKRRLFNGPQFINIIINNKATYFVQSLAANYFNLINPVPIFFTGSQNYQFNPPNTGLIFTIFLPFFYIGLFKQLILSRNNNSNVLFIILFAISLLPAALTSGDYPSIRATTALPFYYILISSGINIIKNSKALTVTVLIALVSLINYSKIYLNYDQKYSNTWQYGYQSAVEFIKSKYPDYKQIVITKKYGEPHEFLLFYWPWDPSKFLNDSTKSTDFHADWYWVDSFDKFKFANDWDIKNQSYQKGTLLVTSPNNYPTINSTHIKTINFLDGTPAFDIISYD